MHKYYKITNATYPINESGVVEGRPSQELQREYWFRGSAEGIDSKLTYKDEDGNDVELVLMGEGPAELFEGEEDGPYTNPDLHRRVDPMERDLPEVGYIDDNGNWVPSKRDYILSIQNLNSYRTTEIHNHNDSLTGYDADGNKLTYTDEDGNEIDISEIP